MAGLLDDAALDAPSDALHAAGVRVLQGHRLADTEAGHVSLLLAAMAPPPGARVADIGCGFGEVARLMRAERPDLSFLLLNRNAAQLRHAPSGPALHPVRADMHALPVRSGAVDGCMVLYTLCHADAATALREAARVTRPGGFLFLFDYERRGGDGTLMHRHLSARAHTRAELTALAVAAGWGLPAECAYPPGCDDTFRALFPDPTEYDAIFRDLVPVLWRLTRQPDPAPAAPPPSARPPARPPP